MRVILAGLSVFIGLMVVVGVLSSLMEHASIYVFAPIVVVVGSVMVAGANRLFNGGSRKRKPKVDADQQRRKWAEQGLSSTTKFQAKRAFEVEEFEDEGKQFFLELIDGSVLFLVGQYLYDESSNESGTNPLFPCTEFTIERHKNGNVVGLHCDGSLIAYETLKPTFWDHPFWKGDYAEDGAIFTNRTFDQLKRYGKH